MDPTGLDSLAKKIGRSPSRRQAIKLLGGGVAAGLAAAAGLRVRGARALPISGSQHDFVTDCSDNGGESSRLRTYVVKCTYACHYYTVCNFNYTPPYCYTVFLYC